MPATPGWAALLASFAAAVLVGLPSIDGSFIRDDVTYISQNPHVAIPASLVEVFSSPFQPLMSLGLYRPVTTLSLRLDVVLGGEERRAVFHATNLLLAGLSAALVAVLAWRLLLRGPPAGIASAGARLGALAAGLIFAVHPVRTEAVCWISGRAENLMTFFALACLAVATGAGVGRPSAWRIASAALLAVLSAFSKEQGFVLALLVPCVAPPATRPRAIQAAAVAAALGLALVVRWAVLRGLHLEPGLPVFEHFGTARRVAQGFALFFDYVRMAVWPGPLLIEYDPARLQVEGFPEFRVIAGLLLFAVSLYGITRVRTRPIVAAGCAVFLLPLIPVLHFFVPIGEDFAERFLALPVAGAALLLSGLVCRFPHVGGAVAFVAVALGAIGFARHAADYRSARVLYEANLRAADSPAAKAVVAIGLLGPSETGQPGAADVTRAEGLLRAALDAEPDLFTARMSLAGIEENRRAALRVAPSERELAFLAETARRFPRLPGAHVMLGAALLETGRRDEARAELEAEIRLRPLDVEAPTRLARTLVESGQQDAARSVLAGMRSRWEAHWRRYPGFSPVALAYAALLFDILNDDAAARAVLAQSLAAASRPKDRQAFEQEIRRRASRPSSR